MFISSFSSLNLLAVTVTAGVGYVLGAFWYSPFGFGRTWLNLKGTKKEDLEEHAGVVLLTFGSAWVSCLVLSLVVAVFGAKTFLDGASVGLIIGTGLIVTSLFSDHLLGKWNGQVFLIQAGYQVCFATLSGGILSVWR